MLVNLSIKFHVNPSSSSRYYIRAAKWAERHGESKGYISERQNLIIQRDNLHLVTFYGILSAPDLGASQSRHGLEPHIMRGF
jgi:hypothetical protein